MLDDTAHAIHRQPGHARILRAHLVQRFHVSCDATDPFGLREQLFEFFGG